ncbi:CidA/LrgA family protein [Mesorhizobium sp. IMUNJ 23232]|uniref:CidA/LrgA family protein n=1 Tax=Mesorhizobium sp. IMUNJ 23232 TaxID=3376064 RepID=UPI0037AD6E8A
MLVGICLLLVFQLIGEIAAYFLNGIVPGPVLGMALIPTVFLISRRLRVLNNVRGRVSSVSTVILANLGIVFVPAGVGIVQHVDLIRSQGAAILGVVLVSTLLTLTATVLAFVVAKRLVAGGADG